MHHEFFKRVIPGNFLAKTVSLSEIIVLKRFSINRHEVLMKNTEKNHEKQKKLLGKSREKIYKVPR